ncbi:hypothetical protein NIES2107_64930 [Nostoc carneum NIES-2107]|nr:hypothetical protein NIES2107_64930 [Nostoc carneum NIES-2107]
MAGAGRILKAGGILYLYGPFKQGGEHTSPSNAAFDEYLRAQNEKWGVRNLDDVVAAARSEDLILKQVYQMPANNLSVVFERSARGVSINGYCWLKCYKRINKSVTTKAATTN